MTPNPFSSREALERHQLKELDRLVASLYAGNPFYAPALKQARLEGQVSSLDQFRERMPLTEKSVLSEDQQRTPPFGTNLTYPLEQYSRFNQTSATSGQPLRWLDTAESWQWMLDNWKYVFRAAGVTSADCLYFAFSFGPFLGFWTAFESAAQLGCLCIPGGGITSLGRLKAIHQNGVTVLLCTPTYALRLTEVAAREGIDLAECKVRTILVAGEPGGSVPAVRDAIERGWPGARVFDHHGMTEVGPVSYQLPEEPGSLVIIDSSHLAEIIDPKTRQPVVPGDVGELVLTTLGRTASPLLRYRTGDLVREETDPGRKHGRIETVLRGGILGRADDMVVVRGVNVYPAAVEDLLRSIPDVAEYQVEIRTVDAMTELCLKIEPAPQCGDVLALARQVESRMRSLLSFRVPVEVCAPGELPRFEMKARRWVRLDS